MTRRFFSLLIGLCALLLTVSNASAARRVALVIGNANYANTPALTNSLNDAEDMAAALRQVGFEVIFERNGTKREMEQAIAQFSRAAQSSEAALFYYAGHGVQFRGHNYLMPIDAKLEDVFSLNVEMTRIDDVLAGLEQSPGVKILILDACRSNPLADQMVRRASTRDVVSTRGLARIDRTEGMVVAYATQADQVAADGQGRNSPFTAALVQRIVQPGLEIGTLFRRVAADVYRATGGRQQPELSVSLLGEFYFTAGDNDVTAWAKVRSSEEPGLLRQFIERHASSPLVVDARQCLAALEREQVVRDQWAREQTAREQTLREQLAREQAIREQIAREKAIQEQLAREIAERQAQQQAANDRLAQEQAAKDRLAQEQAVRERLAQEQAARDRLAQEQAARERLAQEQATRERLAQEEAQKRVQTALLSPAPEKPTTAVPAAPAGEALVKQIKTELKRVGCYFGSVDGDWTTSQTKSSVQKFAKLASVSGAILDPSVELLDAIRAKTGRVCPLQCSVREVERNGTCVAKTCPAGSKLTSSGACEKNIKTASRPPSDKPADANPPGPGPGGKPHNWEARREQCFNAVQKRQFYKQAFRAAVMRCMQGGVGAI